MSSVWSTAMAPHPWMDRALCRETDPNLFFPNKDIDGISAFRAKAVCRKCAVKAECLAYAVADPSLQGIWGATSDAERRAIRKEQNRG